LNEGGIHVRDAESTSSHPGTGALRVGQAAVLLTGAALVYRGATGHWPVPRAVARKASNAVAIAPVETAVTVNKPRAELYAFWRRLENLPRFMKNLHEVTELGDGISRWVARGPLGFKVEWDAEIVEELEGHLLSWRSLAGSQVHNAGTVLFEDAGPGRGTIVRVILELGGPAAGQILGSITEQQVREDIRRFKSLMEAGEIPTTNGQPHGSRSLLGHLHNPL
jgi:uncharacterized membrane protein